MPHLACNRSMPDYCHGIWVCHCVIGSPGESCNEYCLLVLSDAKFAVHASLTSAVTPDIRRSWSRASACTNTQNNVSSCQNCGCFRPLVLITCHLYIFGVGQSCSKLRLDSVETLSSRQLSEDRGLAARRAEKREICTYYGL